MKNEEKFKTVEERSEAFNLMCCARQCGECKYRRINGGHRCLFAWLADEYEGPKPDLPFEIRANSRNSCKSFPVALYCTVEYGNPTSNFIVGLPENYYHDELCKRLNAAALAWHKQMMENEKGAN